MTGFESFNDITCDRRSKLDRSSRMRRKIHVSGDESERRTYPHRFALVVYFLPSSLSSFCLFSLSAATTFHPFFVPRTLNRRISCAAPACSLAPFLLSLRGRLPPPPPPHRRPLRCRDHWAKNWKFRTPLLFLPSSLILESFLQNRVCVRFPQDDRMHIFCSEVYPV